MYFVHIYFCIRIELICIENTMFVNTTFDDENMYTYFGHRAWTVKILA